MRLVTTVERITGRKIRIVNALIPQGGPTDEVLRIFARGRIRSQ